MLLDAHTHVRGWSPDAGQSPEALLAAARERGLLGVCVTDHYDLESSPVDGKPWTFDAPRYLTALGSQRLPPSQRGEGESRPALLTGVELSCQSQHAGALHALLAQNEFDCVVISLHDLAGADPITRPDAIYTGELSAVYASVVGAVADTAEQYPEADVVGHYDFFSRYAPAARPRLCYRHAPQAFDRLFRAMIQNGQALELNTGTIAALHEARGLPLCDALPDPEVFARYRALGGRLVTLGSDAHNTGDVGRYFPQAARWLRELGFAEYAWFERHTAFTTTL